MLSLIKQNNVIANYPQMSQISIKLLKLTLRLLINWKFAHERQAVENSTLMLYILIVNAVYESKTDKCICNWSNQQLVFNLEMKLELGLLAIH